MNNKRSVPLQPCGMSVAEALFYLSAFCLVVFAEANVRYLWNSIKTTEYGVQIKSIITIIIIISASQSTLQDEIKQHNALIKLQKTIQTIQMFK